MIADLCQRWRGGRCRWRPAREGFAPRRYDVEAIESDREARAFVEAACVEVV